MILKAFSILDKATEAFNQPFFMLTKAEALRAFTNLSIDEKTEICKNPLDYHLYYIGEYDNSTALMTQDKGVQDLGCAAMFKQESNVEKFPSKETG